MPSFRQIRKSSATRSESFQGRHRSEHWYLDNQVYFITARCRERYAAFATEAAKNVFWDRFDFYSQQFGFVPWVTSLLDNHYHALGYLQIGDNLGTLMQRLHGSVAKLVNDQLAIRHVPFWREAGHRDYFDGCIRDEKQCRLAFRYTMAQSVRHAIVRNWRDYPHTRINVDLDAGVMRAHELGAFLERVPYKRYESPKNSTGR
jgi:REP element-mobilizing transposase RayT